MGYLTRYELKAVYEKDGLPFDLSYIFIRESTSMTHTCHECGSDKKTVIEKSKYFFVEYAIDENGDSFDPVKWYDHEKNMKSLSKEYPSLLFTLSGKGEENGDIWRKYFFNGKMQKATAQITFEKYDSRKLKSI